MTAVSMKRFRSITSRPQAWTIMINERNRCSGKEEAYPLISTNRSRGSEKTEGWKECRNCCDYEAYELNRRLALFGYFRADKHYFNGKYCSRNEENKLEIKFGQRYNDISMKLNFHSTNMKMYTVQSRKRVTFSRTSSVLLSELTKLNFWLLR